MKTGRMEVREIGPYRQQKEEQANRERIKALDKAAALGCIGNEQLGEWALLVEAAIAALRRELGASSGQGGE